MEPVFVDIIVIVNHPDDVDKLAAFMQNHSTGHVTWSKGNETSLQAGGANGRVNIELIPTIMELPGVISIFEVIPEQPAGHLQQGRPPTTSSPSVLD